MRIPGKQDALIVRGVVIPCGISDNTGDAPQYKEDIKKIFTNYLTHETDVQHSWVKNFGVYVLENTLTEQPTIIAGQEVPQDSWIASMMVVNPEIQEMIRTSKLQGFSLGAVHDDALNENVNFLHKSLRYEQLKDSEDLNPLFISLVDRPACGFNWEVYDYNSFLAKSQNYDKIGEKIMTENNNIKTKNEDMVSTSFVERLMDKFMMKSETNNTEEENKDEELEKAETEDISNAELLEKLPNAVATAVVEALQKLSQQNNSSEEEKLEKDESENEDEKEDNDKIEKEETTSSNSNSTTNEEEEKEKLEKSNNNSHHDSRNFMEKSTSRIVDNTQKTEQNTYLNSEKRDMFGRNKKYL